MFGAIFSSAISVVMGGTLALALPTPAPAPAPTPEALIETKTGQNAPEPEVAKIRMMTVTAYSSSVDETDDSPFTTASNTRTRDGVVATNILPFGTRVRIPSLFGKKEFTVEDRMHQRHHNNIDIWFPSKQEALRFGIARNIPVEVLENTDPGTQN